MDVLSFSTYLYVKLASKNSRLQRDHVASCTCIQVAQKDVFVIDSKSNVDVFQYLLHILFYGCCYSPKFGGFLSFFCLCPPNLEAAAVGGTAVESPS